VIIDRLRDWWLKDRRNKTVTVTSTWTPRARSSKSLRFASDTKATAVPLATRRRVNRRRNKAATLARRVNRLRDDS